jgi:hypothetical protein
MSEKKKEIERKRKRTNRCRREQRKSGVWVAKLGLPPHYEERR